MFGIRIAKIVFALSLLLSCLTYGAGDPSSQLKQLEGKTPQQQLVLLTKWAKDGELDSNLASKVSEINDQLEAWSDRPDRILAPENWLSDQMIECVNALAFRQQLNYAAVSDDSVEKAKAIKRSPVYNDAGPKQTANWLTRAAERLTNLRPSCDCNTATADRVAPGAAGQWFMYTIIVVLGGVLIAFVAFAISRASWSKKLKRKAKALLDEDEPERTLDEWLEQADTLEREGKYREAVRCLYLACLLKIDEARIARFERSQTNWEHLERIDASPRRPADLHFREPTQAFDVIWYGMRVNGSEDVLRFRYWYQEITKVVRPREAA
jgi:hypothetical protein